MDKAIRTATGERGTLNTGAKSEQALLEEATGWILRLESAPEGSPLFNDFQAWLAASDDNRTAWTRVNETWRILGAVKPAPDQNARQNTRAAPRVASSLSLPERPVRPRKSYRRPAVAAVAALAAAWVLWIAVPAALIALRADHRTTTGQTERVHTSDGSTIDLGGSSAIKTDIGTSQRRITLLRGEAFFDVATDAIRPFIVDVQGIEVKVLGTAFDVRATSERTDIALLRGSVQATAEIGKNRTTMLKPGQMLSVDHATGTVTINTVAPEDIGAWREGKIFLVDATVSSAVELIQRYHSAWISIPDRGLAHRKISGLFDLRDPDRALAALVEPFGGKVRSLTPLARIMTRL